MTNIRIKKFEGINWQKEYETLLNILHDGLSDAIIHPQEFDTVKFLSGVLYEDVYYSNYMKRPSLSDWKKSIETNAVLKLKEGLRDIVNE